MVRISPLLIVLLITSSAVAERARADGKGTPVARAAVEKKYSIIEKNLKSVARHKLRFITAKFNETVVTGGRDSDYYSIAKTELKKQFALATADQLDVLVFYTLTKALKHVEKDIEHLSVTKQETSTMFGNLSVKANLIFNAVSTVMKGIRSTNAEAVQAIP